MDLITKQWSFLHYFYEQENINLVLLSSSPSLYIIKSRAICLNESIIIRAFVLYTYNNSKPRYYYACKRPPKNKNFDDPLFHFYTNCHTMVKGQFQKVNSVFNAPKGVLSQFKPFCINQPSAQRNMYYIFCWWRFISSRCVYLLCRSSPCNRSSRVPAFALPSAAKILLCFQLCPSLCQTLCKKGKTVISLIPRLIRWYT